MATKPKSKKPEPVMLAINKRLQHLVSLDAAVVEMNNALVRQAKASETMLSELFGNSFDYDHSIIAKLQRLETYLPSYVKALNDIDKLCTAHNEEMEKLTSIMRMMLKRMDRIEHLVRGEVPVLKDADPKLWGRLTAKCSVEGCTELGPYCDGMLLYCDDHAKQRQALNIESKSPSHGALCAKLECIDFAKPPSIYCEKHKSGVFLKEDR